MTYRPAPSGFQHDRPSPISRPRLTLSLCPLRTRPYRATSGRRRSTPASAPASARQGYRAHHARPVHHSSGRLPDQGQSGMGHQPLPVDDPDQPSAGSRALNSGADGGAQSVAANMIAANAGYPVLARVARVAADLKDASLPQEPDLQKAYLDNPRPTPFMRRTPLRFWRATSSAATWVLPSSRSPRRRHEDGRTVR